MQIQTVTADELGLLITGLRSVHIVDQAVLMSRLKIQLETELSTRYGMMIGTVDEQERNRVALEGPAKRKYTRRAKAKK